MNLKDHGLQCDKLQNFMTLILLPSAANQMHQSLLFGLPCHTDTKCYSDLSLNGCWPAKQNKFIKKDHQVKKKEKKKVDRRKGNLLS